MVVVSGGQTGDGPTIPLQGGFVGAPCLFLLACQHLRWGTFPSFNALETNPSSIPISLLPLIESFHWYPG